MGSVRIADRDLRDNPSLVRRGVQNNGQVQNDIYWVGIGLAGTEQRIALPAIVSAHRGDR